MTRKKGVRVDGAHAVVTGGARGIGRATAARLVAAGARVSLWDLDADALDSVRRELSAHDRTAAVHTEVCDVTDHEALRRALADSVAALGPVDILINNAGHLAPGRLEEQGPDVWMKTLSVNIAAPVYLTRLVLSSMYERGRGHIVNISSAAGAIGVPSLAVYSASKWAVWGFSEALRAEAAERGVMVSSIHPGYIAEGMFAGARLRGVGRLLVPLLRSHDIIAEGIVRGALSRGRPVVMRPRSIRLAVLLRGVLPDRWFNRFMRRLGVWASMSTWRGR